MSEQRVYVAGHRGLVGSAIFKELQREGFTNVIGRSRAELNLLDSAAVNGFFHSTRPEYVILAAGRVGGIMANSTRPAEFIYDNTMIAANVIVVDSDFHAQWPPEARWTTSTGRWRSSRRQTRKSARSPPPCRRAPGSTGSPRRTRSAPSTSASPSSMA